MALQKGRFGIDGWLFVFLALVGGLTPFHHIATMIDVTGFAYNSAKSGLMSPFAALVTWVFFAVVRGSAIVISIWIVHIMWRRREWKTIKHVLVALWILYLAPAVIETTFGFFTFPYPPIEVIRRNLPALLWGVVFAFAGMVYLTSSKRVANTYLKPNSVRQIDETFG